MKKTTKTVTTITLPEDKVREILVAAASKDIGTANPSSMTFDIGPELDHLGFEVGTRDIVRRALVTIPVSDEKTDVAHITKETTVEMDNDDMLEAIAAHVSGAHRLIALKSAVSLEVVSRRNINAKITITNTQEG